MAVGSLRCRRAALILLTLVGVCARPADAPKAQTPTVNELQRLIAGEPLPRNAVSSVAARKAVARSASRRRFVPGRVLLKTDGTQASTSVASLASRVGAHTMTRAGAGDFSILTLPPEADVLAAARDLAAQPGVVYAEPDAIAYLTYVPNDPLYSYQWNFKKLDMERTWDINRGGDSSLIVAVIDSGVAFLDSGTFREAPDLVGTNFVAPRDFIWETDTPFDLDGHGTHVTGTIAERTGNDEGVAGMAFNVSIMPIKAVSGVWDEELGAPNFGSESVIAAAIHYAADNGAKVINMSLGFDDPVSAVRDAIEYAVGKGVFVVAAAGNGGEEGSPDVYPAAYASDIDGFMSVAALDLNLQRAPYSNSNPYVEISAPGGDTDVDLNDDGYPDGVLQQTLDLALVDLGTFNEFGYFFLQGTSMAAPHVSGLAALLIRQGVTDPKAVEAVIERFATDIGPSGRDNDTGFGVINPRATIRGLGISK
jgi:serine protease